MSNELEPTKGKDIDWTTLENVIAKGDLSQLTPEDRTNYYRMVCEAVGLNPSTQPFEYLKLNNKLTLYATRRCTDQLRKVHRVSITRLEQIRENDLFIATAYASTPDGRVDSDVGAVGTQGLKGEALGNAIMKSITKSKRRVTLSICGLGFLDETEVDTIPGATVQAEVPQNRYTPESGPAASKPEPRGPYPREETAQAMQENPAAAVHAERIKSAGKASPAVPPSPSQLAAIAKLSRLLGEPEEVGDDMTSADASERISHLSREYNERKGTAARKTGEPSRQAQETRI